MENKIKTVFQYKVANHSLFRPRNTYVLPTGTSKTRIPVIVAKHLIDSGLINRKILVITPSTLIRDTTWPEEISKWAGEAYLKHFDIQCIQSVYKNVNKHYEYVVADEIHNYIPNADDYKSKSREYYKFFENNKIDRMMGLTADIPKEKRRVIKKICPISIEMSIEEAVERGFISNFTIYNVPIPLTSEERADYEEINNELTDYANLLGGSMIAYSNAQAILKALKGKDIGSLSKKSLVLFHRASKYMKLLNTRKTFLYTNTSKLAAANSIIDLHKSKSIIFSASKSFANRIKNSREDCLAIHSGLTKKKRAENLKLFSTTASGFNCVSVVNAVNEGANLPKLKLALLVSGSSKPKDLIQRLGRTLRIVENEPHAILIQLFNPETQDEVWTHKRLDKINKDKIVNLSCLEEIKQILINETYKENEVHKVY